MQLECLNLTRVNTGFSDVPNSGSLNNVADDKLLDSLILSNTTGTVGAADSIGVSTSVLRSSVIAAFARLYLKNFLVSINECHFL